MQYTDCPKNCLLSVALALKRDRFTKRALFPYGEKSAF